jgi:hypothetical protein
MLRALVLILLAANVAFFAWSQGWLAMVGLAPANERDPDRLGQQVQPETVRVLSPAAASAALAAATRAQPDGAALTCLETGVLSAQAIDAVEQTLASVLPERSWIRTTREVAAQYVVFVGPFATREAMMRKLEELKPLNLPSADTVRLPSDHDSGLALGRYDSQAAAEAALVSYTQRGVRGARVALLREATRELRLRVDNVAPSVGDKLKALNLRDGSQAVDGFSACAR